MEIMPYAIIVIIVIIIIIVTIIAVSYLQDSLAVINYFDYRKELQRSTIGTGSRQTIVTMRFFMNR